MVDMAMRSSGTDIVYSLQATLLALLGECLNYHSSAQLIQGLIECVGYSEDAYV